MDAIEFKVILGGFEFGISLIELSGTVGLGGGMRPTECHSDNYIYFLFVFEVLEE